MALIPSWGGAAAIASVAPATIEARIDSLLSQIEAEKQRIEAQKAAAPTARGAKKDGARGKKGKKGE